MNYREITNDRQFKDTTSYNMANLGCTKDKKNSSYF
jgi:hypothetical protein